MKFKHKDVLRGTAFIVSSLLMSEVIGLFVSIPFNGLNWVRAASFGMAYLMLTAATALGNNYKQDRKSLAFAYRISPLLLVYWAAVAKSGVGTLTEILVGISFSLLIVIGVRAKHKTLSRQVL